jgi:[ribosomal protein S18]-alanine N-acetyltransferase
MEDPDASQEIEIRRLAGSNEVEWCARLMSNSEPWMALSRGFEESVALLENPQKEIYVARAAGNLLGFLILDLNGPFTGYVQTIGVAPGARGKGLGTKIVAFAEQRIFQNSPNVFMCVSSFNARARNLYQRLGYEVIGELKDYIVPGHSEFLLRKTIGAWREFKKPK